MIIGNLKIRKENFGWIICNINDCNVYEVSDETMFIINAIKKENNFDKNTLNKIIKGFSQRFNKEEKKSKEILFKIIQELKEKDLIKNDI